jgi:hypothetical protein
MTAACCSISVSRRPLRSVIRCSVSSRIRAISALDHSRTAWTSSSAWRRRLAASVEERAWIASTWVLASLWSWLSAGRGRSFGGGLHRLRQVGQELVRLARRPDRGGGPGRGWSTAGSRRGPSRSSGQARHPTGSDRSTGRRRTVCRRPRGRVRRWTAVDRGLASARRSCGPSSTEAGIRSGVGRGHASCASPGGRAAGGPGRGRIVVAVGGVMESARGTSGSRRWYRRRRRVAKLGCPADGIRVEAAGAGESGRSR